jgi:hypothetical protein
MKRNEKTRFCPQCGTEHPKGDHTVTCGRRLCQETEAEDAKEREEYERSSREWRKEIAMEEGMLHGVEAYNDAMGYSLGNPDDDYDPHRGY